MEQKYNIYHKERVFKTLDVEKTQASRSELIDVYCKQVRSVLEFASVVWHSSLTACNSADIERVQKAGLAIILGKSYISYVQALQTTELEKLCDRREALCLTFARKAKINPKYDIWFVEDQKVKGTRRVTKNLKQAQARTTRFQKSAIPYMTHILNEKGYTPLNQ